ncbi:MAG: hypothetical protein BWY30_00553 [Tenericutes bacterium ADurb.Bin239]|nr:MAG: hypothetical protein BWY30_00553 [Tenericutes bacterium ADurb.Bin239]
MATSQRKKEIIHRFNKENYIKLTFRLRKGLDKTMIKCLSKRESKNMVIRDALCDNLLKYECSSPDVYEEVLDIREKLRIVAIICKGFFKTEVLEIMLKFYNHGVLSLDGLNLVLNEFAYQYVPDFDDPTCMVDDFEGYDASQILDHKEKKAMDLAKHGYNKEDVLSAMLFMIERDFIHEADMAELVEYFTGLKNLTIDDLEDYRHYYNFGAFAAVKNKYDATIHGIVHIEKDEDDFED